MSKNIRKKIGIDARMIDWGGVGRYTQNLINVLAKQEDDYQYVIFINEDNSGLMKRIKHFEYRKINIPVLSPYSQLKWTWELQRAGLDLFHSPHFIWPLIIKAHAVVTIHDLIPLRFKEVMPSTMNRNIYFKMNKQAINKASYVIVDSLSTQNDIMHFFSPPEQKIKLVPLAADPKFKPVKNDKLWQEIKEKFEIKKRFIFASANPKPHKNLIGIIKAFELVQREIDDLQLVLYGPEDYRYPEIGRLINDFKLNNIIFTGFIPDEYLPILYGQSELYLFPSFYEGFGLPALEAMACGTPVITSSTSSLPEVVGQAAIIINPKNIEEISKEIISLIDNLKMKQQLVDQGFEHVKKFSWDRVGIEIKEIYDELLSGRYKQRTQ